MAPTAQQHADYIKKLVDLQDKVEVLLRGYATKADRIELAIIVLSVLTSGALWTLAADAAPKQLGWAGAFISTVVTFLTIYLYSAGLQGKRKQALKLYSDIGAFIGHVRGDHNITEPQFWEPYKAYDKRYTELRYGKAD